VAAHLDAERRDALFAALLDLKTQAWMTGTDASLFAGLRGEAQFFAVAEARISEMDQRR
jgi:DNA replication and repair protein RecF